MTHEDAAYAAAAWASGTTQTELAHQFGYAHPVSISTAIRRFINTWHPRVRRPRRRTITASISREARKRLVLDALAAYCARRGDAWSIE
jgi:hypothetical protein